MMSRAWYRQVECRRRETRLINGSSCFISVVCIPSSWSLSSTVNPLTSLLHHLDKLLKIHAVFAVVIQVLNHAVNLLIRHCPLLLDVLG